ncbi:IS110 family transposase [Salinibacter sp.]|uniref:IS110 family transposase n=1 Tax=Salinibacter sp. TaxID=2065818 RepID=UPI0021E97414|nr:IS110 family transposase [Salinibacter sp.]
MTAPDRSESATAFARPSVGIDVSKTSLEIALLSDEEEASASRSVPNGEEGFETLLTWIERQTDADLEESPEQVHVCLEASGGYQRPVACFLHERELTVSVVNPQRTSAYADSQLNRSKTDKVDARLLARFCTKKRTQAPGNHRLPNIGA